MSIYCTVILGLSTLSVSENNLVQQINMNPLQQLERGLEHIPFKHVWNQYNNQSEKIFRPNGTAFINSAVYAIINMSLVAMATHHDP